MRHGSIDAFVHQAIKGVIGVECVLVLPSFNSMC